MGREPHRPVVPLVTSAVGVKNYLVAVTDRSVVVLPRTNIAASIPTPTEVIARLPRRTRLGPFTDNRLITVGGIEMFVWGLSDLLAVQAADNEMGYDCPGPPSPW